MSIIDLPQESKASIDNQKKDKIIEELQKEVCTFEDLPDELKDLGWKFDKNGTEIQIPYNMQENIYWCSWVNPETKEDKRLKKKWIIAWKYITESENYIKGIKWVTKYFIDITEPKIDAEIKNRNKILGDVTQKEEFNRDEKKVREFWDLQVNLLNKHHIEQLLLDNFANQDQNTPEPDEEIKRYEYEKFEDYPEPVQKEAMKLIKSDILFEESLKSIAWKHKGNEKTASLELLSCVSLFIKEPVHQILNANSGGGKTDVTNRVKELFPDQYVVDLPSFSEKALFYASKDPKSKLLHSEFNLLFLDDYKSTETKDDLVKLLADNERKKKIHITVIDGKNVEMELPPNWLVQMNRAKEDLDNEVANRFYFNSFDNVKNDTEIKNKIKEKRVRNIDVFHEKKNIILKCAIQYLIDQRFKVYNPYSLFLDVHEHDNRNIDHYFGFIEGKSFYNYNKLKTIEDVTIGSHKEVDEVLNIITPDFTVQKDKITPTQKGIIDILNKNPNKAKTGKELATELQKNPDTIRQLIVGDGNKKIGLEMLGYVTLETETLDNRAIRNKYYFKKDYNPSDNEKTYQTLPIFQNCILNNSLIIIKAILIHYLEHLFILINERVVNILHTFLDENPQLNPDSYNKLCNMLILFNTEIKKHDNIIYVDSKTYPSNKDLEYHNKILEKSKDDIYNLLSEVRKKMAIPIKDKKPQKQNQRKKDSHNPKNSLNWQHKKLNEDQIKEIHKIIFENVQKKGIINKTHLINSISTNCETKEEHYNLMKTIFNNLSKKDFIEWNKQEISITELFLSWYEDHQDPPISEVVE